MMFLQLVFEEKTRIPSLFRQTSHNYFWIPYMKFGGALKFTGWSTLLPEVSFTFAGLLLLWQDIRKFEYAKYDEYSQSAA